MPTLFNKCIECTDSQTDYKIMEILKRAGLPPEIAIMIIKMTHSYIHCTQPRCLNFLCPKHAKNYQTPPICSECNNRLWRLTYEHMMNKN